MDIGRVHLLRLVCFYVVSGFRKMSGNQETGLQLLARLNQCATSNRPVAPLLPGLEHPQPVVELSGDSNTGKTQLLLQMIAQCLAPGPQQTPVLLIDMDSQMSVLRLLNLLEPRVTGGEDELRECLKQFYVMRCTGSSQLLTTLHSLEVLLTKQPQLHTVMIDGLGGAYWRDRSNAGDHPQGVEPLRRQIMASLCTLQGQYKLTIVAATSAPVITKQESVPSKDDLPAYFTLLPSNWQNLVSHRYHLSQTSCNTFRALASDATSGEKRYHHFSISSKGLDFH